MRKTKINIKTPDGEFENNLIFFDKSDRLMLKKCISAGLIYVNYL